MDAFLSFTMTGDAAFDFFFSIVASFSLLFFFLGAIFSFFRGHI
jgi:hypothetical protein